MSPVHLEYEMLCAFAALGEPSAAELSDLIAHVESCSSCHRRLAEMETASYIYFVCHAGKRKGVDIPLGMQQRFEERAGSMGIPLRDTTAALRGTRLVSLVLSVVLLTVGAEVGWKVIYPQIPERTAVQVETSSVPPPDKVSPAPDLRIGDPPVQRASMASLSGGRKTTRLPNVGSSISPHRVTRKAQTYSPRLRLLGYGAFSGDLPLQTHVVVGDYLTHRLSLSAKRTFELSPASRFLADGEYSIPANHAFRYSPTSASLSFLGAPARLEVPRLPAMNEPPPLFRMNSTKAW